MEEKKLSDRQLHLVVNRRLNSVMSNMGKTPGLISALADAIKADKKHIEENKKLAMDFIKGLTTMINQTVESISKIETSSGDKTKKDA